MAKSKPRKPKVHTKRPVRPVTQVTPDELVEQLLNSTARRVLEGLKTLEHMAIDFPLTDYREARIAYEVASLALIECIQTINGDTPFRELVAMEGNIEADEGSP